MHVQETSGLGVGLCGFLCVPRVREPSYRRYRPSEPTCRASAPAFRPLPHLWSYSLEPPQNPAEPPPKRPKTRSIRPEQLICSLDGEQAPTRGA